MKRGSPRLTSSLGNHSIVNNRPSEKFLDAIGLV